MGGISLLWRKLNVFYLLTIEVEASSVQVYCLFLLIFNFSLLIYGSYFYILDITLQIYVLQIYSPIVWILFHSFKGTFW